MSLTLRIRLADSCGIPIPIPTTDTTLTSPPNPSDDHVPGHFTTHHARLPKCGWLNGRKFSAASENKCTQSPHPLEVSQANGGGGIRTRGTRKTRTPVFKTGPFNRSGTPPRALACRRAGGRRVKWGETVSLSNARRVSISALGLSKHRLSDAAGAAPEVRPPRSADRLTVYWIKPRSAACSVSTCWHSSRIPCQFLEAPIRIAFHTGDQPTWIRSPKSLHRPLVPGMATRGVSALSWSSAAAQPCRVRRPCARPPLFVPALGWSNLWRRKRCCRPPSRSSRARPVRSSIQAKAPRDSV